MVRIRKKKALENMEQLLEQAAQGKKVIIEADDGAQFTLTVTKRAKVRPTYGSARESAGWMSDDFDEPLEDFEEYMS